MEPGRLIFRVHAIRRMADRDISVSDVRAVLESGEVIESYPDDTPFPSKLVLSHIGQRPLHVVAAHDQDNGRTFIVTVYEPDAAQWDPTFRRRLDR
ncbi:MAG: DUF4258 domain-containing protein [Actinomycetota bacterium]